MASILACYLMTILWLVILMSITNNVAAERAFKIDRYSAPTPGENVMMCYFTSWDNSSINALKISQNGSSPLCTHVIYAYLSANIEEDNITISMKESFKEFLEEMQTAKITNPQLKSIVGFGGSVTASEVFSPLVANRARAQIFIDSLTLFLKKYGLDGVNLNWRYPTIGKGSSVHDRINYPKFLAALHRRFMIADQNYLLIISLPRHSIQELDRTTLMEMYDMEALNKIVDFYNLLTYDYDQDTKFTNVLKGNASVTFHQSPLYSDDRSSLNMMSSYSVDITVKKYIEAGIDKSKMVLGLSLYGTNYTLTSDSTNIGSPATLQPNFDQTWGPPFLKYSDICTKINNNSLTKVEGTDKAGPYAFKGNQWVSFDDVKMVQNKVEYVAKLGLGGIWFWELTKDDFENKSGQGAFPIMRAAKDALDHIVQGCGEVLTESRGFIHSPNYPATYSNQMFCHWSIKASSGMSIKLTFEHFIIVGSGRGCSSGDKLTIDGESFCDDTPPPKHVFSAGNSMNISFTTDVHETAKGFLASYTFVTGNGVIWSEWSPCSPQCGIGIRTRNNTSSVLRLGEARINDEENCTTHTNCCGDVLKNAQSGVISSPNFPDFYDDDRKCEWILEANIGMFVKLTIEEFDVEFGTKNCNNDYLTITGSRGKDKTYCGVIVPFTIYSTNNRLAITFQTDKHISKKGFNASYEYVSDVDCVWDEYGEWSKCSARCGKGTQKKTRNRMLASGRGNDCKGPHEENKDCHIDCCGGILSSEDNLTTKNFPENYENNLTCRWIIEAQNGMYIKVKFDTFELEERNGRECEYDRMAIVGSRGWDNTYCGNITPSDGLIFSNGSELTISFTTDSTHTRKGFSARVTFVEHVDCVWGEYSKWSLCSVKCGGGERSRTRKKISAIGSGLGCIGDEEEYEKCNPDKCCGGELTNSSGVIESPNYSENYDNDKECTWQIVVPSGMSMKLNFSTFDVAGYDGSCGDDRLVIHGSRVHDHSYCGHGSGTIYSDGNLTMTLITNGYRTRRGFSAEYIFFDCSIFRTFIDVFKHAVILTAVIGIILNIVVVRIFSKADMDNVINRLFTAIALFDIIYLIIEIILNSTNESDTSRITLLKILYPLWHMTTTTTMFINIAAAVERYMAVYHPFKSREYNQDLQSRRKAFLLYFIPVVVIAILFVIPAITEHELMIQNGNIVALPSDFARYKVFYYWSLIQICLSITYVVAVAILHTLLFLKQKSQSLHGKQPNRKGNSSLSIILLCLAFLDFISVIPHLVLFLAIHKKIPDAVDLVTSLPNLVMKLTAPMAIHAQCGIINGFPVLYWNEIACILRVISCSLNFVILCTFSGKFRMSLYNSILKIKSITSEITSTTNASISIKTNVTNKKEDIKSIGEKVSKLEDRVEVGFKGIKDIPE